MYWKKYRKQELLKPTTFFQAIFGRKIVNVLRNTVGQHRIFLLSNPVSVPNCIFKCVQLLLQQRNHNKCQEHPNRGEHLHIFHLPLKAMSIFWYHHKYFRQEYYTKTINNEYRFLLRGTIFLKTTTKQLSGQPHFIKQKNFTF